MMSFRLALRNLRRNKRRSFLASLALAIALMVMVFSFGFLDGMIEQAVSNFIKFDTAHIKAYAHAYMDEDFPGLEYAFKCNDGLIDSIESSLEGCTATPRLEMSGKLIRGTEELFVRVTGVDPKKDLEVFETLNAVMLGETINNGEPSVLIGERLAKDVKVEVGEMVTILVRSAPGAWNPRMLPVSGILRTGHPKADQLSIFVSMELAQEMALLPGSATELATKIPSINKSISNRKILREKFPGYDWFTWEDLAQDFLSLIMIRKIGTWIIIGILALMAAVGIANTMVMSVHERTREIGALRALGFTRGTIGRMFFFEGMLLGIIAGIVGVLLGVVATELFAIKGFSMKPYEDIDIGIPIRDAIYPTIQTGSIIMTFLFSLALSIFASWGSARTAARGEVVRALREGKL